MFGYSIFEVNWLSILLFVLIFALVKYYRQPKKFPPGPQGLPLVGYLPFIGRRPEKTIFQLGKKCGPIVGIKMGIDNMVFLNDYETIVKAYVKKGEVFSGRTPFTIAEPLKNPGVGIAFRDYSESFKTQRKFGLMTLRGFGVGKKGMENISLEESFYLNEGIQKKNGKPFNMAVLLHKAVSNNICHVVFGRRFSYDDKDFMENLEFIVKGFSDPRIGFANMMIMFAPMLKKIPPFSTLNKEVYTSVHKIFDWAHKIADEHEKTFDKNNLRDFIDAFILEKRKGEDTSFTDIQLLHFIHELFLAGTGTASNALSWAILCLLHYPEVQSKMRKEIIAVLGSSGSATMAKKAEMPYTSAFVQEVLRFRTITPLGFIHKATQDAELDGYIIPKGTKIQANIWAVHNDPSYWKDPEKFNPDRFIDDKGNFVNSNHVIPFSVGPRHCLGEQLARMEIYILLVGMVQKFEFLPDPNLDELPDINTGSRTLGFFPLPYDVVAKEL